MAFWKKKRRFFNQFATFDILYKAFYNASSFILIIYMFVDDSLLQWTAAKQFYVPVKMFLKWLPQFWIEQCWISIDPPFNNGQETQRKHAHMARSVNWHY